MVRANKIQEELAVNLMLFSSAENKRIRDKTLDFKGIRASEGVNAIHMYPAMFHPRLVRQLIEIHSKKGESVLDPFMGSGVAAVEASISGRKFWGFDINPLAVLIAQVRTTPIKRSLLERGLSNILGGFKVIRPELPDFMNIDFWFSRQRAESISRIMSAIESNGTAKEQRFFRVALSQTIRSVSRTKPNEFKLVRRKKPCYAPTISLFKANSMKNLEALTKYYSTNKIWEIPRILRRNILSEEIPLANESISLLITSPPYGDSQTTVAYGQFSRLSLQWMELPYNVDKESLGARAISINREIPSSSLYESLFFIEAKDKKRAMHVYSFYEELYLCIKKLVPKVKRKGILIFAVGNRTVKGIQLPTDVICAEMLESLGCHHLETRIREIGNKRMPSKNSPTNIRGEKSPTMRYEYIVICRKG